MLSLQLFSYSLSYNNTINWISIYINIKLETGNSLFEINIPIIRVSANMQNILYEITDRKCIPEL
jgi:hypothetical protein